MFFVERVKPVHPLSDLSKRWQPRNTCIFVRVFLCFDFFRSMEKIAWDGPKWDREGLFPANPDLANILGRMDLDFQNVYFFLHFCWIPNFWISRLPDFQNLARAGLGPWAGWTGPQVGPSGGPRPAADGDRHPLFLCTRYSFATELGLWKQVTKHQLK